MQGRSAAAPPAPDPVPPPPWSLLLRAAGAASTAHCLVLAALGLVALKAGWAGIGAVFGDRPWLSWAGPSPRPESIEGMIARVVAPIGGVVAPFVAVFSPAGSAGDRLVAAAGAAWAVVVWSLFGGAICRVAAVRVARGGRIGVVRALGFSLRRLKSLLAAPAAPLAVAWLIGGMGAAVGLLDRIPGRIGVAAATALAFVPLLVGLLDAVILLGLAAAWPLMVATVVVEGEDFFDALSRSYSYVNQRTIRYAGAVAILGAIGVVGLAAVGLFAATVLGLADWSLALGAPRDVGFRFLGTESADASGLPVVARFWNGAVETIVGAWTYSYLWASAAVVYLFLRRDVDGAEVHDIYGPDQEADTFAYGPPAEADGAGGTPGKVLNVELNKGTLGPRREAVPDNSPKGDGGPSMDVPPSSAV